MAIDAANLIIETSGRRTQEGLKEKLKKIVKARVVPVVLESLEAVIFKLPQTRNKSKILTPLEDNL